MQDDDAMMSDGVPGAKDELMGDDPLEDEEKGLESDDFTDDDEDMM